MTQPHTAKLTHQNVSVNVNRKFLAWLKQPKLFHKKVVQKFKLKCQEMTGETRMSLAVAGRKRQTVQTAHHLAECSRKWRLERRPAVDRRYCGITLHYIEIFNVA